MKIAIIGSSDIDVKLLDGDFIASSIMVDDCNVEFDVGMMGQNQVYFFYRNLKKGSTAPHAIKYKLIVQAIKALQIDVVLGIAIVGSLKLDLSVGTYVVLDQFIDFTSHRPFTVFTDNQFSFVDLAYPYCPSISRLIEKSCINQNIKHSNKACYVGVDGPRFNTVAEIKAFAMLGGDVIGMSNIPEVIMARELGLCYATLGLVVDYASGVSDNKLSAKENSNVAKLHLNSTIALIKQTISSLKDDYHCDCAKHTN